MKRLLTALFLAAVVSTSSTVADITDLPDDSFLWNEIHSVQVIDSFAVVTSDYGLAALKLNPATGFFDPVNHLLLGTQPLRVKVLDYIAMVSSTAGLTYLVDLSDLPQLHLLGELDMGSSAYDLALTGNDLYIAGGFQGLRHYRLTDYGSPEFVDSSLTGVHCVQVEVVDDYLLVLDDYNGILRYDLTEPDLGPPTEILWLPRRAQGFFNIRDTLIIPIVDQPFLYHGLLSDTASRLLDSTVLDLIPECVYALDTFLVAIDTDHHMMEIVSTQSNHSTLYDIHWNPELNPIGCAYYEAGRPHLLLTSDYSGLVSFDLENLWFNPTPREAYSRPGPITSLTFQGDRLFTGGVRNPLEAYQIDAESHADLDTALYGLNSVGCVTPAGDAVLAHFPGIRELQAIRFDNGIIETLRSLDVGYRTINKLKYHVFEYGVYSPIALGITSNYVDIYSISDDWDMAMACQTGELDGDILDAIVVDSFLIVTTDNNEMHSFKLYDGGTAVRWFWGPDVPGPINHMVVLDEREADDGSWWYPRNILGFDGNQMYEITVDMGNFGYPDYRVLEQLPVDVKATALGYGVLYTIGEQGVGVIDLTQQHPTMIQHGGYGGDMIAYGGSTLATSDGSAIHLFNLSNPTAPQTGGEIIQASVAQFLKANYPNPFNPRTQIDFDLPHSDLVEVSVFNLLGQRVSKLLDGPVEAGLHSVEWDGTDDSGRRVASGVYFYRLTSPTISETRKMVLLK